MKKKETLKEGLLFMKNDLKSSAISKVEELAKALETVSRDVKSLTNYETTLKTSIIDLCELYSIENEEIKGFSLKETTVQNTIPLKDLLKVFPNDDIRGIIENVVIRANIDLKATEENLRFSGDFQEPIIKNIIKQLDKLSNKTIKKVELK